MVTTEGLVPELKLRVELLLAEAGGKVTLNSAKRSYAEQLVLWLKYKAGKGPIAAFPGTSKHNKGEAVDLAVNTNDPEAQRLRTQLAQKYGLIRTVASEAWHYELDPYRKPITPAEVKMAGKFVAVEYCHDNLGYWAFYPDGGVRTFGSAPFYGSLGDVKLSKPIVAVAITPSRRGYSLIDEDGNVYSSSKDGKPFGDAQYHGGVG